MGRRLRISGRGLQGQAAPVRASVTGNGRALFQPTTIIFPGEGCWEVTARAGLAALRFVVLVVDCVSPSTRYARREVVCGVLEARPTDGRAASRQSPG